MEAAVPGQDELPRRYIAAGTIMSVLLRRMRRGLLTGKAVGVRRNVLAIAFDHRQRRPTKH